MKKWSNCPQFLMKIDNTSSNFLHFPIDLVATSLCDNLGSQFSCVGAFRLTSFSDSLVSCPHLHLLSVLTAGDWTLTFYTWHNWNTLPQGHSSLYLSFPSIRSLGFYFSALLVISFFLLLCYLKNMCNARKLCTMQEFTFWWWHLLCNFMSDIDL